MKRQKSRSEVTYCLLEPRQLLATNLFVDFGWPLHSEGLTISDSESASLNGPEIFGEGYNLWPFTSMVDGTDEERRAFADEIIDDLQDIFAPFDVNVQEAFSANIGEIASVLEGTASNDAYVFVGGVHPDDGFGTNPDNGASVLDVGNKNDNLAFAFLNRYRNWTTKPITRAIAREAAQTWGLRRVEGSSSQAMDEIMAMPGTDENGERLDDARADSSSRGSIFQNVAMDAINVDGLPDGDPQNSFETLGATVGYSDGSMWFVGTSGDDTIEVTFSKDGPADVRANGVLFESIDLSDGLKFYGPGGINDKISFSGIPIEVEIDDDDGLVNLAVEYFGWMNVETGGQADQVTVNGKNFSTLSTGGGADEILWNVDTRETDAVDFALGAVNAGDGDDTLRYLQPTLFGFLILMAEQDTIESTTRLSMKSPT